MTICLGFFFFKIIASRRNCIWWLFIFTWCQTVKKLSSGIATTSNYLGRDKLLFWIGTFICLSTHSYAHVQTTSYPPLFAFSCFFFLPIIRGCFLRTLSVWNVLKLIGDKTTREWQRSPSRQSRRELIKSRRYFPLENLNLKASTINDLSRYNLIY